jgi:hypothetical protein
MAGLLTILVLPVIGLHIVVGIKIAKTVLQIDRSMMDINERRIVQEIKAIANLEHRYNPYNSSWGLVLEYCKQVLEGGK